MMSFRRGRLIELSERLANAETELVLLREENAFLRTSELRPEDRIRLTDRFESTRSTELSADSADEGWQRLTQAAVVHDVLSDLCDDLDSVIRGIRTKLELIAVGGSESETSPLEWVEATEPGRHGSGTRNRPTGPSDDDPSDGDGLPRERPRVEGTLPRRNGTATTKRQATVVVDEPTVVDGSSPVQVIVEATVPRRNGTATKNRSTRQGSPREPRHREPHDRDT